MTQDPIPLAVPRIGGNAGAYLEEWGTPNRSVVLIDEEGIVRWVHAEETPVTFPPAELIVDALKRL